MKKTIFLFLFVMHFLSPQSQNEIEVDKKQILKQCKFSPGNLLTYLELTTDHSEFIFKQALLETGYFSSNVFKFCNNLFGMHYPNVRETLATGYIIADKGNKVACFNHWTDSVDDLLLYLEYLKKHGYDIKNYIETIEMAGYNPSDTYTRVIKNIKFDFKKLKT